MTINAWRVLGALIGLAIFMLTVRSKGFQRADDSDPRRLDQLQRLRALLLLGVLCLLAAGPLLGGFEASERRDQLRAVLLFFSETLIFLPVLQKNFRWFSK